MKKTGVILIVLLCISTSIGSSIATVSMMNNMGLLNKNSDLNQTDSLPEKTEVKTDIEISKNQNVYQAVSEKAMPSVVGITTTSTTENRFTFPTQSQGVGTGVIVDTSGYILTNSHVVDGNNAVKVSVLFNDGSTIEGKVLWNDAQLDLAVVKVEKSGLIAADLGDSDKVVVGDIAIAIGNPLGLEFQKTVTQGIISGLDRSIDTESGNMTNLIQTDASINPGNSGGPLLNANGEVIGINTAKVSDAEGLGFSIPINEAKAIIDQIINKGTFEKVIMGIQGIDLEIFEVAMKVDLEAEVGVYVAEVNANSPADKAGIQTGDVIVKVDEVNINGMSDLSKVLYGYSTGQESVVEINRGGEIKKINIKF